MEPNLLTLTVAWVSSWAPLVREANSPNSASIRIQSMPPELRSVSFRKVGEKALRASFSELERPELLVAEV